MTICEYDTIFFSRNPIYLYEFQLSDGCVKIVLDQRQGGWTIVWDNEQRVPHMYKGDQWIGYDNPQSIKVKVILFCSYLYYNILSIFPVGILSKTHSY